MKVIHESHPWKSSMKLIHESCPWQLSMTVIYDSHPWQSSMKVIHESHPWKSSIKVIHESHPWNSSMKLIHESCLRQSSMTVHIWLFWRAGPKLDLTIHRLFVWFPGDYKPLSLYTIETNTKRNLGAHCKKNSWNKSICTIWINYKANPALRIFCSV